ncbi:hypothetical protein CLV59_109259 [Chitinophaga dinghuensis]|uniref:Peptidase S74 domain-containing protein n=1 Tax=Chitinophaga dinghuensis TaxID=1539050 RepID=A0A327VP83_9BACT|nr:tail fiber domain-containing protein [Chitinophaga dinghuensis]RAJ75645.1 hypothetical protein CLV59_109259 [Chitinophaga dinghuensis]
MKKIFFLFVPLLLGKISYAQKVYQIRADSVRIYNVCDTAELILENRTQGVNGYLYNKGAGRTEFRKIQLKKIGASQIAIVGQDTLDLATLPGIGGIDTAYRDGDYIKYLKKSNTYAIYAPLPDFKIVPIEQNNPFSDYKDNAVTGFSAYNSPDMPVVSDQAQVNPGTGKLYYSGHAVKSGAIGYQMAVNWDGETFGPKGAFLRVKDDTNLAGWGQWRELLFKDYGDKKYALKDSTYTKLNLSTPGQAQVSWNNLINIPTLTAVEQDNLTTVLTRGNVSQLKMYVGAPWYNVAAPTISLAIGSNDSGINAEEGVGILTLRSNGKEIARWTNSLFSISTKVDISGGVSAQSFRTTNTATGIDQPITKLFGGVDDGYIIGVDAVSVRRFIGMPNSGETLGSVADRGNISNNELWMPKLNLSGGNVSLSPATNPQAALSINGANGSLQIGCGYPNYAYFFTDAPGFFFDKDITVRGGLRFNSTNSNLDANGYTIAGGDGNGIYFGGSKDGVKIYLSSTLKSGYKSIYPSLPNYGSNMYFRMPGYSSGFDFVDRDSIPMVHIEGGSVYVRNNVTLMGDGLVGWDKYYGGFQMRDSATIEIYGDKNLYTRGTIITVGGIQTNGDFSVGSRMKVPKVGIPTIDNQTIYHSGNLKFTTASAANWVAQRDSLGNLYANGFFQPSKASLKKNIVDFTEAALPLLNKLQIKQFVYKDDKTETPRFGIIADSSDWHFSTRQHDKFDTNSSLAITMKAIQELSEQNTKMAAENLVLKDQNETLQKQMVELLKRMEDLEKKVNKN